MLTQYNLKMPHAVYGGVFALPEAAVKAAGVEYYVPDDLPAAA